MVFLGVLYVAGIQAGFFARERRNFVEAQKIVLPHEMVKTRV